MNKKEKSRFPKDFFKQSRPKVNTIETLNDIIPITWSEEVTTQKRKSMVYSSKEKKSL